MKHLKKFITESNTEKIDVDYIEITLTTKKCRMHY